MSMPERFEKKIVDRIFVGERDFFVVPWNYPIERALDEFDKPEVLAYLEAGTPAFQCRFIHRIGQDTEQLVALIKIADQVSVERGVTGPLDTKDDAELIQSIREEAYRRLSEEQ